MGARTRYSETPRAVLERLGRLATGAGLSVKGGRIRRTSSRLCLGVEHGDYNGTELFGVGTDRYIWLAFRPNGRRRIRLSSANYEEEGIVDIDLSAPLLESVDDVGSGWCRFPLGVVAALRCAGYEVGVGFDGVLWGNIPGGGMSRSASLTLNLLHTVAEVSGFGPLADLDAVDLAVSAERDFVGSPCGELDQVMIQHARAGSGVHFDPRTRGVRNVPLGPQAPEFRFVALDTGTVRDGLESSTYANRRAECERFVRLLADRFGITKLADVKEEATYREILTTHGETEPDLVARLRYLFFAQRRFGDLLRAWEQGDLASVGALVRADGLGLRDDYDISGPELEAMCDIARGVPGVLGERMLGGGDKGASGAIVLADAVPNLERAVARRYPPAHPSHAEFWAVHELGTADGVVLLPGVE